ncbi:unnamed protein product, partial [Effrenium voratum]
SRQAFLANLAQMAFQERQLGSKSDGWPRWWFLGAAGALAPPDTVAERRQFASLPRQFLHARSPSRTARTPSPHRRGSPSPAPLPEPILAWEEAISEVCAAPPARRGAASLPSQDQGMALAVQRIRVLRELPQGKRSSAKRKDLSLHMPRIRLSSPKPDEPSERSGRGEKNRRARSATCTTSNPWSEESRKLVNAFVDEDGDVRVKEDSLRDVLSRFRSFSAEAASKVLDTLRLEFLEEIRTLRNASELARGDLKQELEEELASKNAVANLEDSVRKNAVELEVHQSRLKSFESRMKQMTSTISGQAFPVSRPSSPDLTSRIEPSASQTLSVGLVQHAHLAPSGQAGSAPDPRIRQELSKVQQEVKDLARTVSELSGARHAFALRVDLEAQAKTQRNLDQQLLETRLQLNEEVRSLQRHGAELCQGCEERLADQLEHEKAALVAGLSEAGLALAQLQEGSEAQARRLQEQLDAQGRQLQSLAEGLKNADIAKINYQIEELTKDTVSLFDSLASKAEGEETQQLSGEVAKAQARLAEESLRLSQALQSIWPHLERIDEKERKLE